ncbi:Hypothetical predicted protein [Mytilus galloprovincialis]|uniref:CCHC-type domain-containing protein n=1 Tax=Mytilus galloprovincialis TaxID=29158 RepID=A0A8B6GAG1_MYTGA|nr:Hypothetical predicted protein [Mytilus galloprovincialis]
MRKCQAYNVECFHCHKFGHFKEVCDKKELDERKANSQNWQPRQQSYSQNWQPRQQSNSQNWQPRQQSNYRVKQWFSTHKEDTLTSKHYIKLTFQSKCQILRNQTTLLEPLHTLPSQSLAGAKCIVQLDDTGNSYMRLMNPTEKTIHLPANFVVASVSAVDSKSITSLTDTQVDKKTQNFKSDGQGDILDFDFSDSDMSEDQKTILQAFLSKNRQVFAKDLSELGNTNLYKHTIDHGDAPPIRKRFHRQSPPVLEEMNKQIDKMLEHGIIEESTSELAAPVGFLS